MKLQICGGKENACPMCGGTVQYIKIGKYRTFSQCTKCFCLTGQREKEKLIFNFDEYGNLIKGE